MVSARQIPSCASGILSSQGKGTRGANSRPLRLRSGRGVVELTTLPRSRAARVRTVGLRMAIGLAVGAALLLVFLRLVNLSAVYQQLRHLSITFALLCGIAFLSAYVVRAIRWRRLLRPCQVSVHRAVGIYQVATFLNLLLPIQGGELAKSALLRRLDGIPASRSFATVSLDKAMDLLPAVGLIVLLPFVGFHLSGILWSLLILALGALGLTVSVLAFVAWKRERALAMLTRPLAIVLRGRARDHAAPSIVLFVNTLLALIRRPHLLLIAAAYTAVAASLDALSCLLAFKALGVAVPVTVVFYGYTLINLTFILPTPPAHVGFSELMGLLVFSGLFGVNRPAVAATFLFLHPFTDLLVTCTGLCWLSRMGLTLRSTLRLTREQGSEGAAS